MEGFDAVIVRCNPGQINAAGGDQMSLWQNTWGTVPTSQLLDSIYIKAIKALVAHSAFSEWGHDPNITDDAYLVVDQSPRPRNGHDGT